MNVLRSLIYDKQVSLTLIDTTEILLEGIKRHRLSPASAYVYGKAMSAIAFLSACLKEEKGEVSLSVQCEGDGKDIGASGNRALSLRGYIGNTEIEGDIAGAEKRAFGDGGSLTVIRDDGYNRPFVGSCAFPENADFDGILEEYYRISEQLPTRIKTVVEIGENGGLFAGIIALQPLPFATEDVLKTVEGLDLAALLKTVKEEGLKVTEKAYFPDSYGSEERMATYHCNCSREYLSEVLVTLGEGQIRDIIRTEGAVRVHCHYCNTNYEFTEKDADKLFPKKI